MKINKLEQDLPQQLKKKLQKMTLKEKNKILLEEIQKKVNK
jgi:hypothetical protein